MKKEYVTSQLFKHHREADRLNTNDEQYYLQQSTEAHDNSMKNNEAGASNTEQDEFSLSQRLLGVIRRALEVLALDRRG